MRISTVCVNKAKGGDFANVVLCLEYVSFTYHVLEQDLIRSELCVCVGVTQVTYSGDEETRRERRTNLIFGHIQTNQQHIAYHHIS